MGVPLRPLPLHMLRVLLPLSLLASVTACDVKDRVQARVQKVLKNREDVDLEWRSDSGVIASKPQVLFHVISTERGKEVVPFATIGPRGFRPLRLSDRGWRAFDLTFLRGGEKLEQVREGKSVGAVTLTRGMWADGGPVLDSVPNCRVLLPSAVVPVANGVRLLTSQPVPAVVPSRPIADGELQQAMRLAQALIAPGLRIPVTDIDRFVREVHLVDNGSGERPTVVLMYNDPVPASDSVPADLGRPRHFTAVLDFGVYGYKARWTYATVGNASSPPVLRWIDFLDVNADGQSEILFGVRNVEVPLYTIVLKRETEIWKEEVRYNRFRCQG